MNTECKGEEFEFQVAGGRAVLGNFGGGRMTSDGGVLLLREVEEQRGIIRRFAGCFRDYRDERSIEHSVAELVGQRVYGLVLGYEDLNDHDELRSDPLLATLVGKVDPTGEGRVRVRDRGKALAGKSTLNRLELTKEKVEGNERYKKIVVDPKAVEEMFVSIFLDAHGGPPERIVLDLDATDDIIHGNQEGRFLSGLLW